jgi:hypothetical protein
LERGNSSICECYTGRSQVFNWRKSKLAPKSRATEETNSLCPLQSGVFTQVRRETGRKERVRVPDDEGRANHIGPESCASDREVWGEALTGEAMGQVLSHVTKQVRDADAFCVAEGNTVGCAIASASPVPRGRRPWHVADTSCTGTGRSHDWPAEKGRSASGRRESLSR